MKQDQILYQIRTLEKMIARNFICETNIIEKHSVHMPTPTQMQIIEYILKNMDKEIYQKDLEEILNLRRATVSGVLQTMEKNHLIERITDTTDTRTKKIKLNEEAKKLFLKNKEKMKKIQKALTEGISEEDLEVFSKVIVSMKENIEKLR